MLTNYFDVGGFNAALPGGGLGGGWKRENSGNVEMGFGYSSKSNQLGLVLDFTSHRLLDCVADRASPVLA